jgi:hypothetical protein
MLSSNWEAMESTGFTEASALDQAASRAPRVFPERSPLGVLMARPMSLEDCVGNEINDRLSDGVHDLCREDTKILPSFRIKRNRSVSIVPNPIAL